MNERRGRSAAVKESTFTGHIKRLRRAYLVSLILFVTNSERTSPFHTVLSDVIESCGGSTELITIFNRFGICSSVETLKRIIHSVSQDRKDAGTRSLLVDRAFTIASTDNVDFLQSHAAVYSGDQHRSWHATSIQLVQPMPSTAVHCEPGMATRRHINTVGEATADDSTESSSSQHAHVAPPLHVANTEPAEKLCSLLSGKRCERTSPVASSLRTTRSPHTKRPCTFAEAKKHHSECFRYGC